MEQETKKCAICGREGALALFGIVMGLVFIAMSVDVLRKLRNTNLPELETDDAE